MNSQSFWEVLNTALATVCTIGIFSFIFGENRLYRFFEHIFIGIAAGLSPILTLRDFLWPQVLEPLLGFSAVTFPDGSVATPYNPATLLYLVPMAFGSLYYCIYSRQHAWLAKLVIGFSLGISGALSIKGFFAESIPQVVSSFKPMLVFSSGAFDLMQSVSNCIFIVTLILVLNFFFFTFGREGSIQQKTAGWGRPLLMVCFGAFFGSTVMARLALLVERVQFLIEGSGSTLRYLFSFS